MEHIGQFMSSDNLGWIAQYKATRAEVLEAFDRALANKRLAPGDETLNLFEMPDDQWKFIRACLEEGVDRVMAGAFFDEAVPAWDGDGPNNYQKVPCRCPVAFVSEGKCPSGDAQPWDFIRAWDAQWGAFDYDSSEGRRAVIYIVG
jgi:hypothetical protein